MERYVLGSQILQGMGLGNQLFVYISTRCLARRNGMDFALPGSGILKKALTIDGKMFIDADFGKACVLDDFDLTVKEKDERIYIKDSIHDLTHGCYISGADERLFHLSQKGQNILLSGNLQAAEYLKGYEEEIQSWLSVNPAFDHKEYMGEDVCVLNIRGGEYAGHPELFLERKYWIDCIRYMKSIRSGMKFIAVTDDPEASAKVLPEVKAVHGDLAHDYTILKNAAYLIVSNSSFACFPAFTGNAKLILAPKYWARHNISDGFWSSEQNIYPSFTYVDRNGTLFTADACRRELEAYKERTDLSSRIGKRPGEEELLQGKKEVEKLEKRSMKKRAVLSLRRRLHLYKKEPWKEEN